MMGQVINAGTGYNNMLDEEKLIQEMKDIDLKKVIEITDNNINSLLNIDDQKLVDDDDDDYCNDERS